MLDFRDSLSSLFNTWEGFKESEAFLPQSYFEIHQPQQILKSKSREWIICVPASISGGLRSFLVLLG